METRIAVLLAAVMQMVSSAVISPTVQTSSGVVSGIQLEDVDAYLGIRYAQPPVGDLRFKEPQPVEAWEGVYEANKKTPACMQPVSDDEVAGETLSEDCLHLNVWVPRSESQETAPLKAIMVWIFPGAFFSGSINNDLYDGRTLAAKGDVIVVAMNYRLGVLGFLYGGGEDAPGNVAMLDQVAALKWIKENALAFGGDQDQITIFGESSGALAVGMHLLSPLSQGLFTRGLIQGRSPLYTYSKQSPNTGVPLTDEFAQTVGCSDDSQSMDNDPAKVLACLRSKSAEELVAAERQFVRKSSGRFFPRYGDEFLPKSPAESVAAAEFKATELLAGANSNEAALTFYSIFPEVYNTSQVPHITKDQAREHIKRAFRSSSEPTPDEVAEFYLRTIDDNDYEKLVQAVFDSVSDARVVCPTLFFAEAYINEKNPVYFYWFDHHPSNSPLPAWMRMAHIEDIQFVFGLPVRKPAEYTEEEQALSLSVMTQWASFAKSGNPNNLETDDWPVYAKNHQIYKVLKTGDQESGHGPHIQTCKFWRKYYTITLL